MYIYFNDKKVNISYDKDLDCLEASYSFRTKSKGYTIYGYGYDRTFNKSFSFRINIKDCEGLDLGAGYYGRYSRSKYARNTSKNYEELADIKEYCQDNIYMILNKILLELEDTDIDSFNKLYDYYNSDSFINKKYLEYKREVA